MKTDNLDTNGQFLKFRFENIVTKKIIFEDYYFRLRHSGQISSHLSQTFSPYTRVLSIN